MKTATLQAHLAAAKELLTKTTQEDEPFFPAILVMRDGILVAQVIPRPVMGGDPGGTIQRTAQLCADGFGADEIVIIADTYMHCGELASAGTNPVTGQPWAMGDLENLVTHHDGIAKGWVTEALSVLVVPRGEQSRALWTLPYFREPDGKTLTWGDPQDESAEGGRLTHVYGQSPLPKMPDRTVTAMLASVGCAVALAVYEDNRS